MKVMVEVSYYPLTSDPINKIKNLIEKLKQEGEFDIIVNDMSTQIKGDIKVVFNKLSDLMIDEFKNNKASFVMKVIKKEE